MKFSYPLISAKDQVNDLLLIRNNSIYNSEDIEFLTKYGLIRQNPEIFTIGDFLSFVLDNFEPNPKPIKDKETWASYRISFNLDSEDRGLKFLRLCNDN